MSTRPLLLIGFAAQLACGGELVPIDPGAGADAAAMSDTGESPLTWAADVSPVLGARCVSCHGDAGSYGLDGYTAALAGGSDDVPNVIAGEPSSLLLDYVGRGHGSPTAEEAVLLVAWVVDWAAAER